jgi:hypothetical protein
MADKLVLKTSVFKFANTTLTASDGTDLSAYVSSVEINATIVELDGTTFGGTFKDYEAGLEDNTITVNFMEGTSLATVEGVLWAQRGNKVFVSFKPVTAAIAASNPEYQVKVLVAGAFPIGGSIGEIMKKSLTWKCVSVVTRDTTP